jgi:hypothetical protein
MEDDMPGIVVTSCDDLPYGPSSTDYEYDKWRDEVDEQPVGREGRIEEEVYRLEKHFSVEDLKESISESSALDRLALFDALKSGEALDSLAVLRDIRDAWIKKTAETIVDGR